MHAMRRVLLGAYTYLEFAACVLAWVPILSTVRVLHPDDIRLRGRWMRRFGRTTVKLSPLWRFSVEGTPPADIGHAAYVVVANHESTADPFLLSSLPWDMRWISKEELFRLPVIGSLLRWGGDISLRRGDRESVREMMATSRETLAGGLSVMMFPEGTRSADGSLGAFKEGAFQLAIDAGVPVLPLAIEGTRACRPKGSWWFGDAQARVRVLEPIAVEGMGAGALAALARRRIGEALAEMRGVGSEVSEASGASEAAGAKGAPGAWVAPAAARLEQADVVRDRAPL
jgi:1-acyl-sn-glycerol-3-phosphate acyltransferase